MPHSLVFDTPVKKSLKLMPPVVRAVLIRKGKRIDNVVYELDRMSLIVYRKDL
jgi:hypothetical protein